MKLELENQYSFQEAMGYGDDPEPMDKHDILDHITNWHAIIQGMVNNGCEFSDEMTQLESFLYDLSNCKVEFSEPLQEFKYGVTYTCWTDFVVCAKSQEEADELATKFYYEHDSELRAKANDPNKGAKDAELYRRDGTYITVARNY